MPVVCKVKVKCRINALYTEINADVFVYGYRKFRDSFTASNKPIFK